MNTNDVTMFGTDHDTLQNNYPKANKHQTYSTYTCSIYLIN